MGLTQLNLHVEKEGRGTQLYLQTAGPEVEQMDEKSVSNEGKLTGVSVSKAAVLIYSLVFVFTVDIHSKTKKPQTCLSTVGPRCKIAAFGRPGYTVNCRCALLV